MSRKPKKITASKFIRVDGIYHSWEEFSEEQQEELWAVMENEL